MIEGGVSYLDGGLWANCPASIALTEAVAYLGYDISSIRMLSISTTNVAYNLSDAKRVGGLLSWARPVIDSLMRVRVEASHSMAKSLLIHGGGAFHRIDHFTTGGIFSIDNANAAKRRVGMGRKVGCYGTRITVSSGISSSPDRQRSMHRASMIADLRPTMQSS